MNVGIRPYLASDRPGLIQAIDLVCSKSPYMATPRFEPTPAWTHALESPACSCHLLLLAVDAGKPVGWCRLFPKSRGQPDHMVDLGIGLLPGYQSCGIGTRMVRQAQTWARGHHGLQITLTVHRDNLRALRLFEKCGFQMTAPDGPFLWQMQWTAVGLTGIPSGPGVIVEEER